MNKEKISQEKINQIQNQLSDKIQILFSNVIDERKSYWEKNKDKRPNFTSIDSIINNYSNINASISGGLNLIPGPFGMLSTIPEIILVIRNQLAMIYDISVAKNQDFKLNKELLIGIFISSLGSETLGLIVMHGNRILVKRISLRLFQKLVQILAGKVTQQFLKTFISKWLPIVGAVAMAGWSKYTTVKIGNLSKDIFSRDIELSNEELQDIQDISNFSSDNNFEKYQIIKIKSLINLMKVDGKIDDKEKDQIKIIIDNSDINDNIKNELLSSFKNFELFNIDYKTIINNNDFKMGLMIDLISLAKVDNLLDEREKDYIYSVGSILNLSKEEIDNLIN